MQSETQIKMQNKMQNKTSMKPVFILFLLLLTAFSVRGEGKNTTSTSEATPSVDSPVAAGETEYYRVVGAVTDVWGNPIPGALVKSKKGMEAVTEFDGTFSIFLAPDDDKITASYPGLISKKKGIKEQPVVFELTQKGMVNDRGSIFPDGTITVTYNGAR